MAAALLKPTLYLHTSKARVVQNTVLHRALHPPISEKEFFTRMPLCHHQHIPLLPPVHCEAAGGLVLVGFGKGWQTLWWGNKSSDVSFWMVPDQEPKLA